MSQISVNLFNSRSLCNKLQDFHDLLRDNHRIVCVTETWLRESYPDSLVVSGSPYNIFRCDRIHRVGGGCAILVHHCLSAASIPLPVDLSTSDLQALAIEVFVGSLSIVICCVYNPPGHLPLCLDALCNITEYLCDKFRHVCLLGDFNMHAFAAQYCSICL